MNVKIIIVDDQDQEEVLVFDNVKFFMTRESCIFIKSETNQYKEFNFEGKAFKITIKNY